MNFIHKQAIRKNFDAVVNNNQGIADFLRGLSDRHKLSSEEMDAITMSIDHLEQLNGQLKKLIK